MIFSDCDVCGIEIHSSDVVANKGERWICQGCFGWLRDNGEE